MDAVSNTIVAATLTTTSDGDASQVGPRLDQTGGPSHQIIAAETAPTQRDRHLQIIAEHGRLAWQRQTDYGKRAKAETA